MNLKFSGRGIAFLRHYMAHADIRYYLNGIYLEPAPSGHGVIGAATNGHVLGLWRDTEGHIDRPAILSINKSLANACAKHSGNTLVSRGSHLVCINEDGAETYIQPNELKRPDPTIEPWEVPGKFPSLTRVIPKLSEATLGLTGAVNSAYLGVIAASLSGTSKRDAFNGVVLRQKDKYSGILVFAPQVPEALALIMPMRDDDPPYEHWVTNWREFHDKSKKAAGLPLPGRQPSDAAPLVTRSAS